MKDRPLDLIINQLKTYDETEVCDLLGITTEDLIRKFPERIAAKKTRLEQELELFPTGEDPDDDTDYGFQELDFND
jgi:hypothetical protein